MHDIGEIDRRLRETASARAELRSVMRRLEDARERFRRERDVLVERSRQLDVEAEDVAKLESFSPTRILASLRGNRDDDLARERAERDVAAYAVAEAQHRVDRTVDLIERLDSRRRELWRAEEDHAEALAAKEAWLLEAGPPDRARIAELAERHGELSAELREVRQGEAAGRTAEAWIADARKRLGTAGSWATWDVIGGGLFTDMKKHEHLDSANASIRRAGDALRDFHRELGDIGMAAEALALTTADKTFDVWFDNLFSDLKVADRIGDAAVGVDRAAVSVHDQLVRLEERAEAIERELATIVAEREARLLADR